MYGLNLARNWDDPLGIDDGILDDITGRSGRTDTVGFRGCGALMNIHDDHFRST